VCVVKTGGGRGLYTPCKERLKFVVKPVGSTVKKTLRKEVEARNPCNVAGEISAPRDRDVRTCAWVVHVC
jgi:hypothetical protein